MTHLILHKVRGQPAFDVAEQIQIGEELGWIIPTSGHRAYPYKTWPINDLYYEDQGAVNESPIPEGWPDHYEAVEELHTGPKQKLDIPSILRSLVPQIRRRI